MLVVSQACCTEEVLLELGTKVQSFTVSRNGPRATEIVTSALPPGCCPLAQTAICFRDLNTKESGTRALISCA